MYTRGQKSTHPIIVYLENAWSSKQMITEGEAAILLETTRRAFRNQSQSKQRSTLGRPNRLLPQLQPLSSRCSKC